MEKTIAAIITAAAILSACSGTVPETDTPERGGSLVEMTFVGYPETATRTTLGPDYSIRWSTSDAVSLFSATGAAGASFSVSSVSGDGLRATFTGLTAETSNGYYYALYPAQADARLVATSGTLNATLPSSQTGVENSFAAEAALSVARVDATAEDADNILHFKNVGAILSFTVPGNYLNRVRITSRRGDVAMTGPANIKYNDGDIEVSPTTASKNYVEVTFPTGTIGKTFYAVVYPGEYSDGFEVTFYNSANSFNRYTSTKGLPLKRNQNIRFMEKNWGVDDDRPTNTVSGTELISPVISSCGQTDQTSARIVFSCQSGKRDTYKFYVRDASSMGDGTLAGSLETGTGKYGTYEYTFTGLTVGASYDFGVSAYSTDPAYGESAIAWYEDVTMNATPGTMTVSIDSAAENYYDFIVNYTLGGVSSTGVEHGLIFSYTSQTPTCGLVGANGKLPGPVIPSTGTVSFTQCVPNSVLRAGEKCYVRAYCYDEGAGNYVYSPVSTLTLAAQPSGLPVSRSEMQSPSGAVSLFSFTAGSGYRGYCAEADCSSSSPVRLGVYNASMGTTTALPMASQLSSSGALVLVNGQIFGTQGNIGLAYTEGSLKYNDSSEEGISACRGYSNTYTSWQPVTRAILGVDASGVPGAYWCSLIGGTAYFFDRPIPAGTAGTDVYPQVSSVSGPGPKVSWSPREALSTGPMLLYGGKVCVSEDRISTGVYYTNYELWETTSGNIYGSSRPRTAIGYDSATGTIRLVVVTSNVTLTQMALILKGLGCDYAMNLDGGGSTQMQVAGTGELTGNSRSVKSTVGFFAR